MIRRNARCLLLPPTAVAIWLLASAFNEALALAFAPTASELAAAPWQPRMVPVPPSSHVASAAVWLMRNPFEHGTGPLEAPSTPSPSAGTPQTDPRTAPPCEGVSLLAVIASQERAFSVAVLQEGHATERRLRGIGQPVAGKVLAFIGAQGVWLSDAGSLCKSSLFDRGEALSVLPIHEHDAVISSEGAVARTRASNAVAPEIRKGIQQTGAHAFVIERATVDKILEQQNDVRKIRAVPEMREGRVIGIRLVSVQHDALLGVLGMATGDLLESINGFDITDPVKALEAYARLLTADKLTLHLQRGGQPLNLDYDIR